MCYDDCIIPTVALCTMFQTQKLFEKIEYQRKVSITQQSKLKWLQNKQSKIS